jgi:hypothetical protein
MWWVILALPALAVLFLKLAGPPWRMLAGPLTPKHAPRHAAPPAEDVPPPGSGFWRRRGPREASAADRAMWGDYAEPGGWTDAELDALAEMGDECPDCGSADETMCGAPSGELCRRRGPGDALAGPLDARGWLAGLAAVRTAGVGDAPAPAAVRPEHERLADRTDRLVTTALDLETWLASSTISHRGWFLELEADTRAWLDSARADLAVWRYQTRATEMWMSEGVPGHA